MSNKIIVQNMTLKGIENVPGVLDYDQRGLVLAREEDIVITRSKVDEDFLNYLTELGYSFKKSNLVHSSEKNQTYDSVYNEKRIIDFVKGTKATFIDTYQLTSLESEFAKRTKKELYGNSVIAEKYGTKSGFRKLCKKLNIPVVGGFENLKTTKSIIESIKKLKDSKRILLRLDEGVSGAGNFVIEYKQFLKLSPEEKNKQITEYLNRIPQRLKTSGMTVEKWVDNVTSSPSFQFEIYPNGEILLLSSHEQILDGKEKWFVGCQYPSYTFDRMYIDALHEGMKFMNALKDEGFIGHCGIDYIITKKEFFLVEANIRRQGTAYPREYVRRVFGSLENVEYMAKDIQSKDLIGATFSDIKKKFKDLLISPKDNTWEGILIFNTGALRNGGRFDIVIVAKDEKKRQKYLKEINKRI